MRFGRKRGNVVRLQDSNWSDNIVWILVQSEDVGQVMAILACAQYTVEEHPKKEVHFCKRMKRAWGGAMIICNLSTDFAFG